MSACRGTDQGSHSGPGELSDGRALLFVNGILALLSADRLELGPADSPASAGEPLEIARLPGRGLLVGASHGLLLLDNAGRWQHVGSCELTGQVEGAFHNVKGQMLLTTERGVFELLPDARLRQVTTVKVEGLLAMPDGRWLAEAKGALYGLNDSGALVPLLTGVKAAHVGGDRETSWELSRRTASDWIRVGHRWLAVLSRGDAPVVIGDDGRIDRLREPDGRLLRGKEYELIRVHDGRLFVLIESGLHLLQADGALRRVSTEVRLTAGCVAGHGPIGKGRELAHGGRQVFIITAEDKAVLLRTSKGCPSTAIGNGGAWVVADGLFRVGRDNELVPVPLPEADGAPNRVWLVGRTHVIVGTETRAFRLDAVGRPMPLEPSRDMVADGDDRLVVCAGQPGRLKRWVDGVGLEPVAAAADRPCSSLRRARDGSVVVSFDDGGGAVRLDRARTVTALPGLPNSWFGLRDGDLYVHDRGERATLLHTNGPASEVRLAPGLAGRPSTPRRTLGLKKQGLHFVDSRRGFGVAEHPGMLRTSALAATDDGGRSWRPVRVDGRTIGPVNAVGFAADGRHGMAVGDDGLVWTTSDAGVTWERRADLGREDLGAVWLPGAPGEAFVLQAQAAELFFSADSGRSWVPVPRPLSSEVPVSNAAAGAGIGPFIRPSFSEQGRRLWWTADEGDVMTSTDLGRTWSLRWRYARMDSELMAGDRTYPRAVVLVDDSGAQGCVASDAGLYCSDPGLAAMRQRSDVDLAFTDLAMAGDGRHGWAVGADGVILATEDGGGHWTLQSSGTDALLRGVFFLRDALHGWAWGENVLLATRDGGRKWERLLPRMTD